MSDKHYNNLTPAELERLAWLGEELGEASQAIGKILRHGYESFDPTIAQPVSRSNRRDLERELCDILRAISRMTKAGDLSLARMDAHIERPFSNKYFHHQG